MFDTLSYIKRFRMEKGLTQPVTVPPLPMGYSWLAWEDQLLDQHAQVQHQCFGDTLDVQVFPSFKTLLGCRGVLQSIRKRDGFCPGSTWLILHDGTPIATVQGTSDAPRTAALQNLGVIPSHRGIGLGRALLLKALHGFYSVGLTQVYLEVTAKNLPAIQLYRSHGFRCSRTIYKPILLAETVHAGSGI